MEEKSTVLSFFPLLVMVQSALLFTEFVIGMIVNLYMTLPSTINGTILMSYNGAIIMGHMALGVIISVIGAVLLYLAFTGGESRTTILTGISLLMVILAAASGIAFLFYGQNSIFSLMMSIFFLLGFSGYLLTIGYSLRKTIPA